MSQSQMEVDIKCLMPICYFTINLVFQCLISCCPICAIRLLADFLENADLVKYEVDFGSN